MIVTAIYTTKIKLTKEQYYKLLCENFDDSPEDLLELYNNPKLYFNDHESFESLDYYEYYENVEHYNKFIVEEDE